jgi:hypothetical protein
MDLIFTGFQIQNLTVSKSSKFNGFLEFEYYLLQKFEFYFNGF